MSITVSDRDVKRAIRWVDSMSLLPQLQEEMTAPTGRPRAHSYRVHLILLMLAVMKSPSFQHAIRAARIAAGLTREQRAAIGINGDVPYSQIESAIEDLRAGFEPRVSTPKPRVNKSTGEVREPHTEEVRVREPRLSFSHTQLFTAMARAAIPDCIAEPTELAVDATDVETNARRRSYKSYAKQGDAARSQRRRGQRAKDDEWPKYADNGELIHTKDREARDGYRTANNPADELFNGYDAIFATDVTPWGAPGVPPLIRGMAVVPASNRKDRPGLATLQAAQAQGAPVHRVLTDRGFSNLTVEKWALPLNEMGVEQVHKLHPQRRRVRPGPLPRTLLIDGTLFVDSVPSRLRKLDAHAINADTPENLALSAKYDERARFGFRTTSRSDGPYQQYEGPARSGKVRCPNHPPSMREQATAARPTTNCTQGEPCSCAVRHTLGIEHLHLRQRHPYGTTKWLADYGRRNNVETANGLFKTDVIGFTKKSIRAFGTFKHGLWCALAAAVINMHLVASRYGLEPSGPFLNGPVQPLPRPNAKVALHQIVSLRGPPSKLLTELAGQPNSA